MNFIKDGLWFGEQLVSSLDRGGITRSELAQSWSTMDLDDEWREFTRERFRNILNAAEGLYDCVFTFDKDTNRWTIEGNEEDEQRFIDKVHLLRKFMER